MSYGGSSTPQQSGQPFLSKIKIIRTGANRTVRNTEPFYLLESDWSTTDHPITGAANLIEHFGLKNAYQKYFRGNLKEELSGFLSHLSGNVNTPASTDDSGLMLLVDRPPIQGNSFQTFNVSQLDSAVRLYPGPLPQEFMSYFVAPSVTPPATNNGAPPNETGSTPNTKKRRRDAHRSGIGGVASSDYPPAASFSHLPSSNPASAVMRGQPQSSIHLSGHHHPPSAAPSVAMGAPHSGPLMNPSVAASLSAGGSSKPPTSASGYFATPPAMRRTMMDESYNSLTPRSGIASSVESPSGYDFDDEIRRKKRRKEKKSGGSSSRRDRMD